MRNEKKDREWLWKLSATNPAGAPEMWLWENLRWAVTAGLHYTARCEELRETAQEVWDSVPASYSPEDPMVMRHAAALNNLHAVLQAKEAGTK